MKYLKIAIGLLSAFLFNCSNNKEKINFLDQLPQANKLTGKIVSKPQELLARPAHLHYFDEHLVFETNENKKLALFSIKTGQIVNKFCSKGLGPQEILDIYNFQNIENDSLLLFDFPKRSLYYFNFRDNNLIRKYKFTDHPSKVLKLSNNDIYFAAGFYSDARFKLYSKGQIIDEFKRFPKEGTNFRDTSFMNLAYYDCIAKHPSENLVVNIVCNSEIIECYSIVNNKITLKWNYELSIAEYGSDDLGGEPQPTTSDEAFGFTGVKTSDKNIFCMYTDRKWKDVEHAEEAEYIFVFDWEDGKLCKVYKLDNVAYNMAVSDNGESVYTTTIKDDDVKIMKYAL